MQGTPARSPVICQDTRLTPSHVGSSVRRGVEHGEIDTVFTALFISPRVPGLYVRLEYAI